MGFHRSGFGLVFILFILLILSKQSLNLPHASPPNRSAGGRTAQF